MLDIPFTSLGPIIKRAQGSDERMSNDIAVQYDAVMSGLAWVCPSIHQIRLVVVPQWALDIASPGHWAPQSVDRVLVNVVVGSQVENIWYICQLKDHTYGMLIAQRQRNARIGRDSLDFGWAAMLTYPTIESLLENMNPQTWDTWFKPDHNRFVFYPVWPSPACAILGNGYGGQHVR